jgi:hypothetical protein
VLLSSRHPSVCLSQTSGRVSVNPQNQSVDHISVQPRELGHHAASTYEAL